MNINAVRRTLATAVLATILMACGGSPSSSSSSTSQETLSIAVPGALAATALAPYASAAGYFDELHLTVTMTFTTNNLIAGLITSGQADVGQIGIGVPLSLSHQGKQTQVIYNTLGGGVGAILAGKKSLSAPEDLKQLANCRIGASGGQGTSSYGVASVYNQRLGTRCEIVPLSDIPTELAALVTGRVDAATFPYESIASAVDAGQVKVLIDTRDQTQRTKYMGQTYPEAVYFTTKSVAASKKEALARFVKGVDRAAKTIVSQPEAQSADVLEKVSAYSSIPAATLARSISFSKFYFAPNKGYVSQDNWKFALTQYQLWGLTDFNPNDAEYSYANAINMKPYESVLPKP
jgi:ABC-type nitrate/sulfonate/bicarbonate transport system substrate-binding protein